MSLLNGKTTNLLNRLRSGDDQARNLLIDHANAKLLGRARQMLRSYPKVARWEMTNDVLQNALIHFNRALFALTPDTSSHFWRLATAKIRQVLLDLARHYQGPQGQGANHFTDGAGKAADDQGGALQVRADERSSEPSSLAEWTEFHEKVQALPDGERAVFDLHWYGGLTQEAAAQKLNLPLRTVRRRWRSARLKVAQMIRNVLPLQGR